jgi:hypothetical protein
MEKTFTVKKTAEVGINVGLNRRFALREAKLSDLTPGVQVHLQLSADQKEAEVIIAEGPSVRGQIKAVDAGKKTITVTTPPNRREEAGEERTYTLAPNAEVGIDDGRGRLFSLKEAKLADLASGAPATLRLTVDQKHVLIVIAEGPIVHGTVKSLDAGKKQITILAFTRGEEPAEKTLDLAAGADVQIDDGRGRRFSVKEGKLADVPAGCSVTLRLTVDQKSVVSLRAEGPQLFGLLRAVDAAKNTITVTPGGRRNDTPPEDRTLSVAKDVRIQIEGKEAKLADLKAEDNGPPVMLRLSLDQKVVQSISVGRGR